MAVSIEFLNEIMIAIQKITDCNKYMNQSYNFFRFLL